MAELPELPEWAERQVGPLPAWGWVLAIGGGLAFGWYVRRRGPEVAADPEAADGSDTGLPSSVNLPASGLVIGGPAATDTSPLPQRIETNQQWRARAVEVLTIRGYSPSLVDIAIAHYLLGEPLESDAQNQAVDDALRILGVPPEGAPPLQPFEPPEQEEATSPTALRTTPEQGVEFPRQVAEVPTATVVDVIASASAGRREQFTLPDPDDFDEPAPPTPAPVPLPAWQPGRPFRDLLPTMLRQWEPPKAPTRPAPVVQSFYTEARPAPVPAPPSAGGTPRPTGARLASYFWRRR